MDLKELQRKVIGKAASDPSFRDELIKNPKEVMEKEFGEVVPEGLIIKIEEEQKRLAAFLL